MRISNTHNTIIIIIINRRYQLYLIDCSVPNLPTYSFYKILRKPGSAKETKIVFWIPYTTAKNELCIFPPKIKTLFPIVFESCVTFNTSLIFNLLPWNMRSIFLAVFYSKHFSSWPKIFAEKCNNNGKWFIFNAHTSRLINTTRFDIIFVFFSYDIKIVDRIGTRTRIHTRERVLFF